MNNYSFICINIQARIYHMKILTAEQIREVDRLSTEQYGIPSILLMENAGMRVVEVLADEFENLHRQ